MNSPRLRRALAALLACVLPGLLAWSATAAIVHSRRTTHSSPAVPSPNPTASSSALLCPVDLLVYADPTIAGIGTSMLLIAAPIALTLVGLLLAWTVGLLPTATSAGSHRPLPRLSAVWAVGVFCGAILGLPWWYACLRLLMASTQ